MDVAMRLHPRERGDSYLNRQRDPAPDDSGTDCKSPTADTLLDSPVFAPANNRAAESLVRRKFQRTANDGEQTNATFRKPTQPASASAPRPSLENRPSFSHHRRRSALREHTRVPSGPRDFPGSSRRYGMSLHTATVDEQPDVWRRDHVALTSFKGA